MDRLRSILNLERGEELPAFLLFSYLTLVIGSYMITKAVRDGIFLTKFSAMTLPWVYIGVAVIIGFVVAFYIRLSSKIELGSLVSGSLLFFTGNILLLWWLVRTQMRASAPIFYVWTSIFGITITTQVWTVANSVLDLRQAKRLFPLISSGGILGGAAGGLIGARLVKVKSIGTDNLMLFVIPLLFLSIIIVRVLAGRLSLYKHAVQASQADGKGRKTLQEVASRIMTDPYLKLVVGLVALSAIVTLVVDFQLKIGVQNTHWSKDQLTAFFASFYAYLSLGAFLLQVIAGSRLVEQFGIRTTVFILPLAITAGTGTLIAFPLALWAVCALKGSDYVLRYSVDRATTELLYFPIPQSVKADVKAFIDMVMQRLADGVGGALLLLVTLILDPRLFRPEQRLVGIGAFNLLLLAVWARTAFQARKEYVRTLWQLLLAGRDVTKDVLRTIIDGGSRPSIETMLTAKDEEVVLFGMEMLVEYGHPEWIPRKMIEHDSPRVRLKAMEILALTESELLDRVKNDSSSAVRASAILKVSRGSQSAAGTSPFLQSPDLRVRLSALIALAKQNGSLPKGTIKAAIDRIARDLGSDLTQWREVAEALGEIAHPEAGEFHLRLLQHHDPGVRKQAILSAGRAGHRELVPFLVPLLASPQWAPDARLTLRGYGNRILGTLADTLRDPTEDIEVRRNIPLVLAYVPDQAAVNILLDGLSDPDGLVRYRVIRALGKLRILDPQLKFDFDKIVPRLREDGQRTIWFQQALAALYPDDTGSDLLLQLLKDKISRGKDRVFRLLALLLPPRAAIGSILVIREGDRLAIASVTELLDNLLPGKLKDIVLPLIEPKPRWLKAHQSQQQILAACLRDADPIMRECAADAVRKPRWPAVTGLKPLLAQLEEEMSYGR